MKSLFLRFLSLLAPGAVNYSGVGTTNGLSGAAGQNFANDIELIIADEVLRLSQRQLVAYQFGEALRIPKGHGATYTATRFERLPLPLSPLQEGVSSVGETITIAQVSATAQQWGDSAVCTDVADLTIKHPLFKRLIKAVSMQEAETLERNTFNQLLTATQVNYANGRASRAALLNTDVLTPLEIDRVVGSLETFGAPMFNGDEREDMKREANGKVKSSPAMPHYVSLIHPLPTKDMRQNATVATAWSQSDLNRLYNNDLGEWGGAHFCKTNMIPWWVGVATVAGATASPTGGTLAGAPTNYYIQVTGSPAQTNVEQRIYQVSGAISVTGPSGSISLTLPTLAGYTFSVYIGLTAAPANLATCASGPATGPMAGQATQLASGATVVLTGVGTAQTPPAAPATGVTVYPTFFFGTDAYGQVLLDDAEYHYLKDADKSDRHNQLRVVSWKIMYGTIILNNAYMCRVESGSNFSVGFTAGTATE